MVLTEFTEDNPQVNNILERNSIKKDDFLFYVAMLLVG